MNDASTPLKLQLHKEKSTSLKHNWKDISEELHVTKVEMKERGYHVVEIIPGQVGFGRVDNKFGFSILVSRTVEKELRQLLGSDNSMKIDTSYRQLDKIIVMIVLLKDEIKKNCLITLIYYHSLEKPLLTSEKNLYMFFRTLTNEIIAEVTIPDYRVFTLVE